MRASRFSCDYPSIIRMLWYMIFSPSEWRRKALPSITDHKHGEQFQLSEDEEIMMNVLSENMHAVANLAKVRFWKLNKLLESREN